MAFIMPFPLVLAEGGIGALMWVAVKVFVLLLNDPDTATFIPFDRLDIVEAVPFRIMAVLALVATEMLASPVLRVNVPALALRLLMVPVALLKLRTDKSEMVEALTVMPLAIAPRTTTRSPTLTSARVSAFSGRNFAELVLTVQVPSQLETDMVFGKTADTIPSSFTDPWLFIDRLMPLFLANTAEAISKSPMADDAAMPINFLFIRVWVITF